MKTKLFGFLVVVTLICALPVFAVPEMKDVEVANEFLFVDSNNEQSKAILASTSHLSDDSAKEFLQFLSGNFFYNPDDSDLFYSLITGRSNDRAVQQSFISFVYNSMSEQLYLKRLNALRYQLESNLPTTLKDAVLEVVTSSVRDELIEDFTGLVDTGDMWDGFNLILNTIIYSVNVRGKARSDYFVAMLGQDQSFEYYDIISAGMANGSSIGTDQPLVDEWLNYMYSLERSLIGNTTSDSQGSYNITFDSNCSDVETVSYIYESSNDWYVPTMSRNGYLFAGWYYDKSCKTSAAGNVFVNQDLTFYAKWIRRLITIYLDSNCAYVDDISYKYDIINENGVFPAMNRDGYIFSGWYWDSSCNSPVQSFSLLEDQTFYAKWTPMYSYTVDENANATITGLLNYTTGQTSFALPAYIDGYKVTQIGDESFYGNDILVSVSLPYTITDIGYHAFATCSKLSAMYLAEGVINIGDSAFAGCTSLETINIPESVICIGYHAFLNCPNLKSVYITNLSAWCNIDFNSNPLGINTNLYINNSLCTNLVIPDDVSVIKRNSFEGGNFNSVEFSDNVVSIGEGAFRDCTALATIYFSEKSQLTDICAYAFSGCIKLSTLELPEHVTIVSDYAFSGCTNLESIYISDSVSTIGVRAFSSCTNLKKISFGENSQLKIIGTSAFEWCSSMLSIRIPKFAETIGNSAFSYCQSLVSVDIPSNIISIGIKPFFACTSLENITVDANNPNYSNDTKGVLFNKNKTLLIQYPSGNSAKNYEIPNSVTGIGWGAFALSLNLSNIKIPPTVTSIGSEAFGACRLSSVTVLNKEMNFGTSVFSYNPKDFVLYGYADSTTETYAADSNIPFISFPVTYPGASIRALDNNKLGIRFMANVMHKVWDDDNSEVGFIIARKSVLGNTELAFGCGVPTAHGAAKTGNVRRVYQDLEDGVYFTGVLHGIPEGQEDEILVGRPYMKIDGSYYYGDVIERSVLDVALAVKNDGNAFENCTDELQQAINRIIYSHTDFPDNESFINPDGLFKSI